MLKTSLATAFKRTLLSVPNRNILLHEYQSADILHQYNIPLPRGNIAMNHKEAFVIARKFGADYKGRFVVKAQVQCPSRRLGNFRKSNLRGGVHIAESIDEVQEYAEKMCGNLMSYPTNEYGARCNSVLIYEKLDSQKEFFFSIDYDRTRQQPVITYSQKGGMSLVNIEKRYPDSIFKIFVDVEKGLDLQILLKVATNLGIHEKQSSLVFLIKNMWECFIQRDALRVQINPLLFSKDNKFYASNCLLKIDPSASFRQQEIQTMQDFSQMTPIERAAEQAQLRFVKMNGDIGVISNGAALGMSTMDVIDDVGGSVSCFVDIGGQTFHEQISYVLDLLGGNSQTKVILFNCFGGMHDMGKISAVLIDAVKKSFTKGKPIVVRMKGLSAPQAIKSLQQFNNEQSHDQDKIHIVEDFTEACELAVKLSQ